MNRLTLLTEMSLNLDGRLPVARREHLLRIIADDPEAARLWDELQGAQELALSLRTQHVSSSFQASLWERIRAGEGTPEAVFREPVPTATKLRYLASGAAAAALFIATLQFITTGAEVEQRNNQQLNDGANRHEVVARRDPADPGTRSVAASDPGVASWHDGAVPNGVGRNGDPLNGNGAPQLAMMSPADLQPVQAWAVAERGQRGVFDSVNRLRRRAPELEQRLDREQPRQLIEEINPQVEQLRSSTQLMRWMEDEQLIRLPGEYLSALETLERTLRRIETSRELDDRLPLLIAVQDLKELEPERLQRQFTVLCCSDAADFESQFSRHLIENPPARRVLRIVVQDGAGTIFDTIGVDQFRVGTMHPRVFMFTEGGWSSAPGGGLGSGGPGTGIGLVRRSSTEDVRMRVQVEVEQAADRDR